MLTNIMALENLRWWPKFGICHVLCSILYMGALYFLQIIEVSNVVTLINREAEINGKDRIFVQFQIIWNEIKRVGRSF